MAPAPPTESGFDAVKALKPTLDQIKDGKLSFDLSAAIAVGDMTRINQLIAQVKTDQPDVAATLQNFVNTHKFDQVKKTWGDLSDVINNAKGLASAATGGVFDLSGLISAVVNPNTWLRIGEGAMGIILLAIGVSVIAKSTSVGQSATKAAATAAKVIK